MGLSEVSKNNGSKKEVGKMIIIEYPDEMQQFKGSA
jgi:hypothetical protein